MKRKYYLILSCIIAVFFMVGCSNNSTKKTDDVVETTSEIENESDKETDSEEATTDESTSEEVTSEEATTEIVTEPVSTEATTEKNTEKETEKVTTDSTSATTKVATETTTQKQTETHTTEKVTTTDKTIYNPLNNLKMNATYRLYIECYDVQIWVYDILFSEDGKVNSFLSEAYMLESSWQGEKTEDFITYNSKKYYPVGAGGGGFNGTYSLTDETINVEDDNMYNGGGSIIFTMTAEGNIVVKSVNGVDDTRFKVGNIFILVK